MRLTTPALFKALSIVLVVLTAVGMFFSWVIILPDAGETLVRSHADEASLSALLLTLLGGFGIDMGYLNVNIFIRYIDLITMHLTDFRLSPYEVSATVGNVVKIYKLMQMNTGYYNFILAINESFLKVSTANVLYLLVYYGTLFYLAWTCLRRYWRKKKDRSALPFFGILLLIGTLSALVSRINATLAQSAGGTVLTLTAWPFVCLLLYGASMVLWRMGLTEEDILRLEK